MSLLNNNSKRIYFLPSKLLTLLLTLLTLASVLLLATPVAAQESDYRAGLKAYLNNDYDAAKLHWLEGAKKNDPKAMFNLGLLHEQKKISDADVVKADKWYRLAGKNGYPAADYHSANLLRAQEGQSDKVKSLLERAASNGYAPARQALGLTVLSATPAVTKIAETTSTKLVNNESESTPQQNNANAQYLDEAWIKAQNTTQWTIQMLAFEELTKVKTFIDEHELNRNAAYFTERTDKGVLYKLIYGSYSSKEQADQARQSLSSDLKEYGPWLRPIKGVQALLN